MTQSLEPGQVYQIAPRFAGKDENGRDTFEHANGTGDIVVLQRRMLTGFAIPDWYCATDFTPNAHWQWIMHESRLAKSTYLGQLYDVTSMHEISNRVTPTHQTIIGRTVILPDDLTHQPRREPDTMQALAIHLRDAGIIPPGCRLINTRYNDASREIRCFPDKRSGLFSFVIQARRETIK